MNNLFTHGAGTESAFVQRHFDASGVPTIEGMPHGVFRLEKFWVSSRGIRDAKPYDVIEAINAYTNAGGVALLNLLAGAGGTAFNAANAYIGVGDSSTANSAAFTDLQAATNKLRVAMDSTYPSLSGQVMTWKSTFTTGQANYAWNETAIFNASSGGTMLCRTVTSFGTKTSAAAWTMTYTITVP